MAAFLPSLTLMRNTWDEDMDFTFEDFEMPEAFTLLAGME